MGLLVGRSVKENISLSRLDLVSRLGWIAGIRERRKVTELMKAVTVKAASIRMPVSMLSGGNQQKLLFARSVMCSPSVFDRGRADTGVDVGSKRAIYDLLTEMAASGMGVVVISSDLEESTGTGASSPRHAPRSHHHRTLGRTNERASSTCRRVHRVEQRRNGSIMNVQVETSEALDIDDGGSIGFPLQCDSVPRIVAAGGHRHTVPHSLHHLVRVERAIPLQDEPDQYS